MALRPEPGLVLAEQLRSEMKWQFVISSTGNVLKRLQLGGGVVDVEPEGLVPQQCVVITCALSETLCPFPGGKEDL